MPENTIRVHFAFPDSALAYDCDACDQRCCKSGALVVFPAERQALIRHHPALELVAPQSLEGITAFAAPPSGCWFLEDSRCGLVGSAETPANAPRPLACTLFPFNLFGQLDGTLVVAPNGLCPLRVRAGRGVAHADVREVLERVGAAGEPPLPLRPDALPEQLLLEQLILDAATASLDEPSPVPLIAFTELATEAFIADGVDALATLDVSDLAERSNALYARMDDYARVLGIPSPGDEALAASAPTLAAWTPTVRLFGLPRVPLHRLAEAQLGVALYAAHWQELAPHRPLLPQSLMQMVSSLAATVELLVAWDEPWPTTTVPGLPVEAGVAPRLSVEPYLADDPLERTTQLRRLAYARQGART